MTVNNEITKLMKDDAELMSQPDPLFGQDIEERYRTVFRRIEQTVA
jgi:hypothetical protein